MPYELNKREWSLVRQSFINAKSKKTNGRPRRLFSAQFIEDQKRKLDAHRRIFREIMAQYVQQRVTLNEATGELSAFKLDTSKLLQDNFTEEEIARTYNLIKRAKVLPLQVSQQVLALHPELKELRTATLLTTHDNKYHV